MPRLKDLVAALSLVAAIAVLSLTPPADAAGLASPDGRMLAVLSDSILVDGAPGDRTVGAVVALLSPSGEQIGLTGVGVTGCDGARMRLIAIGERAPVRWTPGGDRMVDLLAESICNLAPFAFR